MPLDRRLFLGSAGAAAAWMLLPAAGLARRVDDPPPARAGKVLVLVYLRGGLDGLNLVVPFGDPDYARLRPSIAIGAPSRDGGGAVDLDGFFGLHPRAAALAPLLADGRAVALPAVGSPAVTRSHFVDQDWSETLVPGNDVTTEGFLNRHLATTSGDGVVRAISLGAGLPRSLRGDARAYALQGLDDLTVGGRGGSGLLETLERAYGGQGMGDAERLVGRGGEATVEVLRELQEVARRPYSADVVYPDIGLGPRLREAARLIRADIGVEVIALDHGNFDTHQTQGQNYGDLVDGLASPLAAFAEDLGERLEDVLVLTVTEFGRTARENGTGGTDHGWASCAFALGGPVHATREAREGPVHGRWPGLAHEQLNQQRDLDHTLDVRDLLAEAVGGHLGNPALDAVLPEYAPEAVGLVAT